MTGCKSVSGTDVNNGGGANDDCNDDDDASDEHLAVSIHHDGRGRGDDDDDDSNIWCGLGDSDDNGFTCIGDANKTNGGDGAGDDVGEGDDNNVGADGDCIKGPGVSRINVSSVNSIESSEVVGIPLPSGSSFSLSPSENT